MTTHRHLGAALEARLADLPSVPPERYLSAGRRAAHRRRGRRAALLAGAATAVVAGLVTGHVLTDDRGPQQAREREVSVVAQPAGTPSLSSLTVRPGLGGVDAFTTDQPPSWATEYGNHGPAALAPDGRLWIAPEASVVRIIVDPAGGRGSSYALEVRDYVTADGSLGGEGQLVWSYVDADGGGTVDTPGRWTVDFGVWAENFAETSRGEPGFAERLVHFAGDRSLDLVAGAGAEIVAQAPIDAGYDRSLQRQRAAQVRIQGQTWFVLASGKRVGGAFYEAFDEGSSGVSDLAGFTAWVEARGDT